MNISGKNILFIAPKFYSYHKDIIDLLERKSARVTFYEEDLYTPLYRVLNRTVKRAADYLKDRYRNKILQNISHDMYDIVFVIRGGILSPQMLEYLKERLPNAKFVMYQWDSMLQSKYDSIIKYFDVVKTFDREDAKQYGLKYLPLFYTKKYQVLAQNKKKKRYDLVFFGAYHSDRLKIVKEIDEICKKNGLNFKYHLFITKMGLLRLILLQKINIKDLKYLKTYSVGTDKILEVYKESKAVLDIELNIQNGLTMRTFEALGAELKLLTTNYHIKDEPFYNDKNIIIIKRDHLELDLGFFQSDFCSDPVFEHYLFENWIENIFGGVDDNG
ncbi:hypothetical protein [Sulfurimonas sp. HSL-1716]|uniref:hypothetical protein n=1 Tax=Hydrocurvibacter sulfurireducens TaxID=3131937 RepID=UPI0031F957C9